MGEFDIHSWKCHLARKKVQAILSPNYDKYVFKVSKILKIKIIARGKLDLPVSKHQCGCGWAYSHTGVGWLVNWVSLLVGFHYSHFCIPNIHIYHNQKTEWLVLFFSLNDTSSYVCLMNKLTFFLRIAKELNHIQFNCN